jgi:hypothetical protein
MFYPRCCRGYAKDHGGRPLPKSRSLDSRPPAPRFNFGQAPFVHGPPDGYVSVLEAKRGVCPKSLQRVSQWSTVEWHVYDAAAGALRQLTDADRLKYTAEEVQASEWRRSPLMPDTDDVVLHTKAVLQPRRSTVEDGRLCVRVAESKVQRVFFSPVPSCRHLLPHQHGSACRPTAFGKWRGV